MVEKGLIIFGLAMAIMVAGSALGNSLHVFYAKLNCQMANAKICIIEEKR